MAKDADLISCKPCNGSGTNWGFGADYCPLCKGQGLVPNEPLRTIVCAPCKGTGRKMATLAPLCEICGGYGSIEPHGAKPAEETAGTTVWLVRRGLSLPEIRSGHRHDGARRVSAPQCYDDRSLPSWRHTAPSILSPPASYARFVGPTLEKSRRVAAERAPSAVGRSKGSGARPFVVVPQYLTRAKRVPSGHTPAAASGGLSGQMAAALGVHTPDRARMGLAPPQFSEIGVPASVSLRD